MHEFVDDKEEKETRHNLELLGGRKIRCKTHDRDVLSFHSEDMTFWSSCLFEVMKEIEYTVNE